MEKSRPQPLAVSVVGTAVTVEFTVKLVALGIVATDVFGGFVVKPLPVMPMPTARLVVLAVLIVGLVPSVHPVSVMPAAVSDKPLPLPVAALLMTKVVAFVTTLIVAFAGMFVPEISMPGHRPVVLAQVTVVVPFVVTFVSVMGAVLFPVLPRCFTSCALRTAVVVQAFCAPVMPLAIEPAENVSRHTVLVVCAPVLYCRFTLESVAPPPGSTLAVTVTASVLVGDEGDCTTPLTLAGWPTLRTKLVFVVKTPSVTASVIVAVPF